jgi:hypothetical protein
MARTSGTVDIQLGAALAAAHELSNIAKRAGDLPTMYAANRAWRSLYEASQDRDKRMATVTNGN